jgi:hypothetical protein
MTWIHALDVAVRAGQDQGAAAAAPLPGARQQRPEPRHVQEVQLGHVDRDHLRWHADLGGAPENGLDEATAAQVRLAGQLHTDRVPPDGDAGAVQGMPVGLDHDRHERRRPRPEDGVGLHLAWKGAAAAAAEMTDLARVRSPSPARCGRPGSSWCRLVSDPGGDGSTMRARARPMPHPPVSFVRTARGLGCVTPAVLAVDTHGLAAA